MELDFKQEAENTLKTRELFKNDYSVEVPHIYQEYSNVEIVVFSINKRKKYLLWSIWMESLSTKLEKFRKWD